MSLYHSAEHCPAGLKDTMECGDLHSPSISSKHIPGKCQVGNSGFGGNNLDSEHARDCHHLYAPFP